MLLLPRNARRGRAEINEGLFRQKHYRSGGGRSPVRYWRITEGR